jgi:hypothetical protein
VIESHKEWAEVHFSTTLQARRGFTDSSPVELLREELRNSRDEAPPPVAHDQVTTFDLPLSDAADAATGGKTLDAAALSALRRMFLLLDEWDRRNQQTATGFLRGMLDRNA